MLILHVVDSGSTFDVTYLCECGHKDTLKIAIRPNMMVWCDQKRCGLCYGLTREQALGVIAENVLLDAPANLELPIVIPF